MACQRRNRLPILPSQWFCAIPRPQQNTVSRIVEHWACSAARLKPDGPILPDHSAEDVELRAGRGIEIE